MRVLSRLTPAVLLVSTTLMLSACQSAEERAEDHYQSALSLIAEGDVDRAMVELRNVFNLNGNHRDARRTMAELQLERGNRQGAYGQYLRLAEQDPDDLETRIILTEMAFLGGNWDEVDRHGARVEELAPEDPRVKAIALVRAYRAATREDDAAVRRDLGRQADAMLADQPENVLLHNILIDDALREQDYTRALAEIDWVIAYDPTNSRNYQERLRVLALLGDMEAVAAQLREMIEIFPDDPAHKATLIRFYLSRDDLDAAEAFLRELAAASAPDDPGPTVDLIRFLAELRSTEAARVEIEKAIAERPDPVPFQIIEAGLDFNTGKRDDAIATLEGVLAEAEPSEQTRNIQITLAKMLLATGNEVGARTRVEAVLAEESTHPEALKMQAAWQIEADDTDAAIGGLRMALDQVPEDAEALTLMANAYSRAGQPDLAKEFLARAVEASGNAPAETLRYARLLIGEESYLPAEDILLAALRLAPSNTDILVTLGQLYLQMEDFGRAQSVADALRRIGGESAVQAANGIEAERLNRQRGTGEAMAFLEELADDAEATLATRISVVRARLGTGDIAGALALAEELKRDNPDNESLDVVLAVARAVNGDLDAAAATYRDLLASDPARPGIWLELSRLQQRQGDRDAARATIDE
ncbi:MAG: tetratricopeptide repeat protein, partial [Rhodovulum sp.]